MIPRLHVLLDDPEVLATELSAVARAVSRVTEEPFPDALQKVRYGRGIVARGLLPKPARELTRALARHGFGAFLVSDEEFVAAPRARRVGGVELREGGLSFSLRGREGAPPIRVDWEEVWAIHPCALLLEAGSEEREALPRRGDPLGGLAPEALKLLKSLRRQREKERTPVRLAIEVLSAGPTIYRLSSGDTGIYANLERKHDHSLENFLELLQTLLAAAPERVLVPPSTRRFLAQHEVEHVLFAKREALESFTAWMIQARLRGHTFEEGAEELEDDELQDGDEAIVMGEASGEDPEAEDLEDEDLGSDDELEDEDEDDELEDEDDELEDEDEDEAEAPQEAGVPIGAPVEGEARAAEEEPAPDDDHEVRAALEHFETTSRLDQAAIEAMLTQSRDLDEDLEEEELPVDDGEVQQALDFFDGPSGPWDVSKLLDSEER